MEETGSISNALKNKWSKDIQLTVDEYTAKKASEQLKYFNPVKLICLEIISRKDAVVFGGTALNEILPDRLKFYCTNSPESSAADDAVAIQDIDILSSTPLEDSKEFVEVLCGKGIPTECRAGMHEGSYVIKAYGSKILDVVMCREPVVDRIKQLYSAEIRVHDLPIRIIDLNMMQYMFYAEFTNPIQQPYRWAKMFPRYVSLINTFPVNLKAVGKLSDHFEVLNSVNPFESEAVFAVWRAVVRMGNPIIGAWAVILLKQSVGKPKKQQQTPSVVVEAEGGAAKKLKSKKKVLPDDGLGDDDLDKGELDKLFVPSVPDINVHELEDKFLSRIGPEPSAIPVIEFMSETPEVDARYVAGIIGRALDKDVTRRHPTLVVRNFDEADDVQQDSVESAFVEFRKTKIYVNNRLLVSIVHTHRCMGFNHVKGKAIGSVDTIMTHLYNTMLFNPDLTNADKNALRHLIGAMHEMCFDDKATVRSRLFRRFHVECFGPISESFMTLMLKQNGKIPHIIRCPKKEGAKLYDNQAPTQQQSNNNNNNKHRKPFSSSK